MSFALLLALAVIGFAFGFGLRYSFDPIRTHLTDVVTAITTHYLDERHFRVNELLKNSPELNMSLEELESALDELVDRGILLTKKGGFYVLLDPLLFLTERDIDRASRITKNDDLLYGGYQHPFLTHMEFFTVYGIFIIALIISSLTIFDIGPLRSSFMARLPTSINWQIFLLFLLVMSIILVDAIDNVVKAWARERYAVVVGAKSGVTYDTTFADEMSGRVSRGSIREADLDITRIQKLWNFFAKIPRGNVRLYTGKKQFVMFRNMPFPRELFYVIRSIQLQALSWRKRHARTLMMWRAQNVAQTVR